MDLRHAAERVRVLHPPAVRVSALDRAVGQDLAQVPRRGDLAALAREPRPAAIVLVTHHVEEIPAGFTHALVLCGGTVVGAGPLHDVLTGATLSQAFQLPIEVRKRDGRIWARLGDDTGTSHVGPMMDR